MRNCRIIYFAFLLFVFSQLSPPTNIYICINVVLKMSIDVFLQLTSLVVLNTKHLESQIILQNKHKSQVKNDPDTKQKEAENPNIKPFSYLHPYCILGNLRLLYLVLCQIILTPALFSSPVLPSFALIQTLLCPYFTFKANLIKLSICMMSNIFKYLTTNEPSD